MTASSLAQIRLLPVRPGDHLEMAISYVPAPLRGTESEEIPSGRDGERGAVLFSPQPFLGGDLDNNVILAAAQALAASGVPVVRFNYRSVGASHDVAPGRARYDYWREVEQRGDIDAVLEDADEALRRAGRLFLPGLLVGYSFGAYVALRTVARHGLSTPLVLIAPPVGRLDFTLVKKTLPAPLMIFAGADRIDPPPSRATLKERFPGARIEIVPDADHFFRGREKWLGERILAAPGSPGSSLKRK